MIYAVYRSKYNKESLHSLKHEMTLEEFLEYREYITIHEDMEYAANKDQELALERQRQLNRGR